MINYIIINGTNSNTINGLGINELPPISKPPLRVQIDTIDGRDGDITTNLGYGAYDKTITIGLFGTGYDINDIISFFNGEGTVVFSNEPDKYYKYKIIEQIDYEALLKFKSASITFHCQPFKYPLEETPIEIEYEYIEQDNVESATLNNTNGGTSLKIDLKGNTSQYTTTGKNKFNVGTLSSDYMTPSDNPMVSSGISINDNVVSIKILDSGETCAFRTQQLIPNKTYTISAKVSSTHCRLFIRLRNLTDDGYLTNSDASISGWTYNAYYKGWFKQFDEATTISSTVAIPNCLYWLLGIGYNSDVGVGTTKTISNIQVEEGSQTTDYEEYTGGIASPNPDYPQPINVVSGDNTVKVEGKNLFNSALLSQIAGYNTYNGSTGLWTTNTGGAYYRSFFYSETGQTTSKDITKIIPLEANTTYSIKIFDYAPSSSGSNKINYALYDETGTYISGTNGDGFYTFTTPNQKCYLDIRRISNSGTISFSNIMIVKGTYTSETFPNFEPYQSNSVLLTLGDKEICWIGNYKDKIFKAIKGDEIYDSLSVEEKNTLDYGKWYLRKAIGKVVLDGSENWALNSSGEDSYRYWLNGNNFESAVPNYMNCDANYPDNYYLLTNSFKKVNGSVILSTYGGICSTYNRTTNVRWILLNTNITTLNDFKTWLNNNNLILYYGLYTPTNELFNDAQQEQLEDIYYNMLSYEGQTNVSQENNDKPFLLDLIAMKDGSDEVVINNIGNTYAKPTIALEGTGETDIYLNNTEILKVDLSEKNKITIDTNNMEAYDPTDNTLANRKVVGNYNSMTLPSGNTTMKITGALEKATITDYSRWL